jgi:hypothetical protein
VVGECFQIDAGEAIACTVDKPHGIGIGMQE